MTADTFNDELLSALPKLHAFCRMSFGQDASDIEQDAVAKALANRHRYEPGTNMAAWLRTIARNTHAGRWRKERRMRENGEAMDADTIACPRAANPDLRLDLARTIGVIDTLSPNMRDAITAVALGDGYDELSVRMAAPVGTIKCRVHRARSIINPERNPLR